MKRKKSRFKSCLTTIMGLLIIGLIIMAEYGYIAGSDWLVRLTSARNLIIGAIIAALLTLYDPFASINPPSSVSDGFDSGERLLALAGLVGAWKVFFGRYEWNSIAEWGLSFVVGLAIFIFIGGIVWFIQGDV